MVSLSLGRPGLFRGCSCLIRAALLVLCFALALVDLPTSFFLRSEVFQRVAQFLACGWGQVQWWTREKEDVAMVVAVELLPDVGWNRSVGCVAKLEHLNRARRVGVVRRCRRRNWGTACLVGRVWGLLGSRRIWTRDCCRRRRRLVGYRMGCLRCEAARTSLKSWWIHLRRSHRCPGVRH